jgi:hypothetical protein
MCYPTGAKVLYFVVPAVVALGARRGDAMWARTTGA